MQGIFVEGRRPRSKREIVAALAADPSGVEVEATSLFENEFSGPATKLPSGQKVYFVGPDPFTSRKFYGILENRGGRIRCK